MRAFQTPLLGHRRPSAKAGGQGSCPCMCKRRSATGDEKKGLETGFEGLWLPEKELEINLAGERESLQASEQRRVLESWQPG